MVRGGSGPWESQWSWSGRTFYREIDAAADGVTVIGRTKLIVYVDTDLQVQPMLAEQGFGILQALDLVNAAQDSVLFIQLVPACN